MTPEELLRDLRAIHLPEPVDPTPNVLAFEPFLVAGVLILVTALVAFRRRRLWRRRARALLLEIDREPTPGVRWSKLVALAAGVSRHARSGPLPDCVFRPADRIGSEEVTAVRGYVRQTLR